MSLLCIAAHVGADRVVEQGGEVEIGNEMGDTPLWIAYWHGQPGVVKMLVESATSRDGHVEVVEYLLDLGVLDVDERDNGGEVVRVLVEKGGVDLDVRVWESDPGALVEAGVWSGAPKDQGLGCVGEESDGCGKQRPAG